MFLGNGVRISDVAQTPTIVLDMPALNAYIAGMKATQYTIRNVPEQVDRVIRQKAKKSHKSLNAVLLDILKGGAGMTEQPVEHHDLDELIGSWVADPEFDAAMEAFESVDEDLWK